MKMSNEMKKYISEATARIMEKRISEMIENHHYREFIENETKRTFCAVTAMIQAVQDEIDKVDERELDET